MNNFENIFPAYLSKGKELYRQTKGDMFSTDRIIMLHEKYNLFPNWLDEVIAVAQNISQNISLAEYCYGVYALIADKEVYRSLGIVLPFDKENPEFKDMAPLFPVLYFAEEMIQNMTNRGLPEYVIADTLNEYDTKITDHYDLFKTPGLGTMWWIVYFVYGEIIRVGRFNIQMCKFRDNINAYRKGTDIKLFAYDTLAHTKGMLYPSAGQDDEAMTFPVDIIESDNSITGYEIDSYGYITRNRITVSGYDRVLTKGDNVLSIHIPSHFSFDIDYCKKSLDDALDIITEYYPEFNPKAFICTSWMVSTQTKQILGKETNVTRFADLFIHYPVQSQGRGVYSCVFTTEADIPVGDLPENTSMQKAFKKYISDGYYFYEMGGLRFFGN